MAVTPVRTSSPSITVTCPTRTPATSVIASSGPGGNTPGASPRSRARGRGSDCAAMPATIVRIASAVQFIGRIIRRARLCFLFRWDSVRCDKESRMRIVIKRGVLCLLLLLAAARLLASQDAKAPIYVALWFDTEDYILQQDDDAAKRIAELLTSLGIRATFKVVGEKARVLDQRGRRDVIAALKKHDIGYHSNTHS